MQRATKLRIRPTVVVRHAPFLGVLRDARSAGSSGRGSSLCDLFGSQCCGDAAIQGRRRSATIPWIASSPRGQARRFLAMTEPERRMSDLDSFAFGDTPELANELLALVLAGKKTATCWAASEGLKGSRSASAGSSMTARGGRARS